MGDGLTQLQMAEALDRMDEDVTSWEADFLNSILEILRFGSTLSDGAAAKLQEIYDRYLGEDADETTDDVDC